MKHYNDDVDNDYDENDDEDAERTVSLGTHRLKYSTDALSV